MAVLHHERSDSEPGTDTVGIYAKNHEGKNRECFIWIRLEKRKLGEKGSLPPLLEDPLISETCALEESASHHYGWDSDSCLGVWVSEIGAGG